MRQIIVSSICILVENNTIFTKPDIEAVLELHGCLSQDTTDIVAIFDRRLRYVYINERGCKQLNTSAEKLLGQNIIEVYPQIIASTNHRNLLRGLSGESVNAIITGRQGDHFTTLYRPVYLEERLEGVFVRSWLS